MQSATVEIMCFVRLPPTVKLQLWKVNKMIWIYSLILLIFYPAHGSICIPTLLDSIPDKDSFKQIECEASTCSSILQLRFEKIISKQWTPVYERVNETYHQSLNTNLSQYSLRNRSDYLDFHIKHILYINPLTVEDQGKWRCVVTDITGLKYASEAMDINIYGSVCLPTLLDSIPDKDNFKQIECEASTCSSISQLRFEKMISKQWTSVYERVNETYHQSLNTNLSQYSLKNRSDYTDFHIKHVLYINPLTLEDQGKWRCVVTDITGLKYASEAMYINIYVTPPENLTIVPNNVELYTNQTIEFMCMAYGIHPVPDVLWIADGTEQYTGTPSNKQHLDGLWSVMNTIKLSFNTVGVNDLICLMRTTDRDRWMQNHIRIIVKDIKSCNRVVTTLPDEINNTPSNINLEINSTTHLWIIYSVLSVLGFLLAMIALWLVAKKLKCIRKLPCWSGRQPIYGEEYEMVPVLDTPFLDSPNSASFEESITLGESTWSIWRSPHQDCVFVGGQGTPSITTINYGSLPSRYILHTGTSIVNGHYIDTTSHVINVYDETLNTYSIYCVDIETISIDGQLTINTPLKLSAKIKQPGCIFAIDKSSIGIYCTRNRMIDVFCILCITKPVHDDIIKLTNYDANENDSLCVNPHGHICVLSYKHGIVYIHNRRGDLIYTFNTGMLIDPLQIQCFSDNSLAVVNMHGEVRRFHENSESKIINLDENNNFLQAAVFTKSLLWVIDAIDSTKIHVFKTNATQKDN